MKILNVEQMTEIDKLSGQEAGVPSILLMENAAVNLWLALRDRFGPGLNRRRILILCGKGNNGGDGLALARQMRQREIRPEVWLLGRFEDVQGDAGINLEICRRLDLTLREVASEEAWTELQPRTGGFDVIVDAMLGTGLTKPLRGLYALAAEAVNSSSAFVLSVDIPSGMFSDSTLAGPLTVRADLTVTFTSPKIAHALNADQEAIGKLRVVPIGSPGFLLEKPGYYLNQIEARQAAAWLPPRRVAEHKGSCGHVCIVAGSRGKAGAAALSARAALRAGSGLVTALTPSPVQDLVASFRPEVMTEGLPCTDQGTLARSALDDLLALIEGKDAVGAGPGLSTHEETVAVVRQLVRKAQPPMVLDADAVNCFAGSPRLLQDRRSPVLVLTPHPGEFSRLTGLETAEILSRPVEAARDFAREHGLWLVLKGFRTLVAEPAGQVWVCPLGNPGMASAGMGDVLTGALTSMLGYFAAHGRNRPEDATRAAAVAVYVHALAGDLAVRRTGAAALAAGDVADTLGRAIRRLERRR